MNTQLAGVLTAAAAAAALGTSGAHAWPSSVPVSCGCPSVHHHHATHAVHHQTAWRGPAPAVPAYQAEGPPPNPPPSLAYGGPGPAGPYPGPAYGAALYAPAFYGPAYYGPGFGGAVIYRGGFHRAIYRPWPHFHRGFGVHGASVAWRGAGWRGAGRPGGRRFG